MEEDFTALLSAAVAVPIHWRRQPILQKAYPYINLSLISSPTEYYLGGPEVGAQQFNIQVDVWAETYSAAVGTMRQVKAALSGFQGVQGSTVFHGIFEDGWRDRSGEIPLSDGGQMQIHCRSGDYSVAFS